MKEILISRDSKSKIRVVEIVCNWYPELQSYILERFTGLLDGKQIKQPIIEISKGKAKRTISEQATLEFNSHVKKYKDKGYKSLKDFGYETLDAFKPHIEEVFPKTNTDTNNIVKPMLCKVYDSEDKKSQNKKWLASRKHDGLRCFIYMRDGKLHTASRGGQDYDVAAYYILTDAYIKQLLTDNPGLILDGELYCHGWNLQKISGLGRLETLHPDHTKLRFHCYDIVDETKPFKDRWEFLKSLQLPWNTLLTIVEHVEVQGDANIDTLHNQWVEEGYEGLVLRDPNEVYKPGGRDRRMQKVKKFTDGDFKILGIVDGLRDEDMCFLMETPEGYQFKAKPVGDRVLKQYYRANIENIIGQIGIVKYFGYTATEQPVPNLPVFLSIRNNKDIDE